MEAREHAENLVRYFERLAHEDAPEVWRKGLSVAQEWLCLIDADHASQVELSAFIDVVHANRYRTSAWFDLALGAYHWISTKSIPVPPPEVFFVSEGVPTEVQFTATPLERAHMLVGCFEQYHREDPSNAAWAVGLDVVREWLRLCEAKEASQSEVSALVRKAFENHQKYLSKLWFDMAVGISNWCKLAGNLNLIPDDFRRLLDKE
jgi:hypothetical protein